MKTQILSLYNETVGEIEVQETIFGLNFIRDDIIKLVIDWQRAKARSGNHQTKTVSDVSGTTKKPFKQKGTGNARQGSLRSVQMRGGGVSHGPQTRSHATKLTKRVRKLGLINALSMKFSEGKLLVIDEFKMHEPKTSILLTMLEKFAARSMFMVDGDNIDRNFSLAMNNIPHTILVPQIGANVYDIIKADYVLISKSGLESLEERLK
jgi:large subunit ribosomal protein L4